MAERLRSAIETLFNVRDEANALAASAEDRRRRRNEFVESLRSYGMPILFLLVAAALIAVATHFLVWSFVAHIVMPLVYAGVPGLVAIEVGGSSLLLGQFIVYVLYAAAMVALAVFGVRAVLARPQGFVRERTKTCPACGMTVLDVATRCRFCGSALSGRRSHTPPPPGRGPAPTLSSSRSRDDREDRAEGAPRRRRRGGRRRGGGGGEAAPGPGGSPGGSTGRDR